MEHPHSGTVNPGVLSGLNTQGLPIVTAVPIVPIDAAQWALNFPSNNPNLRQQLPNPASSSMGLPSPSPTPTPIPQPPHQELTPDIENGRAQVKALLDHLSLGQYWELLCDHGCDTLGDLLIAPVQLLTRVGFKRLHAARLAAMVHQFVRQHPGGVAGTGGVGAGQLVLTSAMPGGALVSRKRGSGGQDRGLPPRKIARHVQAPSNAMYDAPHHRQQYSAPPLETPFANPASLPSTEQNPNVKVGGGEGMVGQQTSVSELIFARIAGFLPLGEVLRLGLSCKAVCRLVSRWLEEKSTLNNSEVGSRYQHNAGILASVFRRCPNLKDITLDTPALCDALVFEMYNKLRKISRISLKQCEALSDRFLSTLLVTSHSTLKSVEIDRGDRVPIAQLSDDSFVAWAGHLAPIGGSMVTSLTLRNFLHGGLNETKLRGVTDSGLEAAARACPKLECLTISRCRRVGDSGLKGVASSCPLLRKLTLELCRTQNGSPPLVTADGIRAISMGCAHLSELTVNGLDADRDQDMCKAIGDLLQSHPFVSVLRLDISVGEAPAFWHFQTEDESSIYNFAFLTENIKSAHNLRELSIGCHANEWGAQFLNQVGMSCNSLEVLELLLTTRIPSEKRDILTNVELIAEKCKLKSLSLTIRQKAQSNALDLPDGSTGDMLSPLISPVVPGSYDQNIINIARSSRHLTKLCLRVEGVSVSDKGLAQMLRTLDGKQLISLELAVQDLNRESLSAIASECCFLDSLKLSTPNPRNDIPEGKRETELVRVLKSCPHLSTIDLTHMPLNLLPTDVALAKAISECKRTRIFRLPQKLNMPLGVLFTIIQGCPLLRNLEPPKLLVDEVFGKPETLHQIQQSLELLLIESDGFKTLRKSRTGLEEARKANILALQSGNALATINIPPTGAGALASRGRELACAIQ